MPVLGFAVRTVKTPDTYGSSEAAYNPGEMVDVLKRGAVTVRLVAGARPKPGDRVYWTAAGLTPNYTAHAVCEITNARFRSQRDMQNCAEVVLTQRQL